MTDKEFDDILKGKLEEYQPEYDPKSWDSLEGRIDELEGEFTFDDAVRSALTGFTAAGEGADWSVMEGLLDKDTAATFDGEVKGKVENYTTPYNPESWPILDNKIDEDERLRRRLVAVRILEVAAVLIALMTFYNVYPTIKGALDKREFANQVTTPDAVTQAPDRYDVIDELAARADDATHSALTNSNRADASTSSNVEFVDDQKSGLTGSEIERANVADRQLSQVEPLISGDRTIEIEYLESYFHGLEIAEARISNPAETGLEPVGTVGLPEHLEGNAEKNLPQPVAPAKSRNLRLSLGASFDLNNLFMPSAQFYSNGRKIKFSEKDLLASGYSTGAGLIFDKGRFSFETGLYYSAKTFAPNRVLKVGQTFDVRTVDFREINLHVVSVPLNMFWNFDRKGSTRFYTVTGASVNIIGTANYDLLTRGGAASSGPSGGSRTDLEVAQVREHLLDGAEFSTKSYVAVVGGLGVEHYFNRKFSIYAQPTYNYQVPFFQISDLDGKHLQYISMQLGTRVRLK